jgi:hypothetical protein
MRTPGAVGTCVDRGPKRADDGSMQWRSAAAGTLVLTLGVLVVGGCSGGSGNGDDKAPPPISVQEYGTTLAGAIQPLDSALKALAKASAYKGLEGRVTAVEKAADQALTELTEITPPAEVAGEHSQLLVALDGFHDEVADVSSQVHDRALCTASAVRGGLGNADQTSALRDALAAVSDKLPDDSHPLTLPSAGQKPGARPPNGELIRAGNLDGRGQLTIKNGGSDAVVTLAEGRKQVASVFVRKGKQATVNGVPDGSYTVFFTGGSLWDGKARAFGRNCAFQRFENRLRFDYPTSPGWIITLKAAVGGNAPTKDVDPDDFPDS